MKFKSQGEKNILIDYEALSELSGFESFEIFQSAHKKWINDSLANDGASVKAIGLKSVAVANHAFVKETFHIWERRQKDAR